MSLVFKDVALRRRKCRSAGDDPQTPAKRALVPTQHKHTHIHKHIHTHLHTTLTPGKTARC